MALRPIGEPVRDSDPREALLARDSVRVDIPYLRTTKGDDAPRDAVQVDGFIAQIAICAIERAE